MFLLKNKNLFFILTIAGASAFFSCNSQTQKPPVTKVAVDSSAAVAVNTLPKDEYDRYHNTAKHFFDSLLKDINGSYLVAKDGQVVLERYVGFMDPQRKKDSITSNSAFHLASVSKTFTAMATLKLWQDGRLRLEDDLTKYFPNFPYPGVTVKMLLTHRSGLPNYVHYLESYHWDKRKLVTNLDVLSTLYTMHPPLQFATGKHFAYCNTNYALLALIIEKVSNMKYADFLSTTFFKPLQMNDTYVYNISDSLTAMPSFEYNNRRFPLEFLDLVYGDKNVYSTVRDMLKWDQALYAGKFFQQATLDSAFSPYSFEKNGKRNYGLGWRMTFMDNGKKLLYHNGWWHGNNTAFIRLIDEHATIIVLGNKFNKRIYQSKKLADMFGDYQQHGDFEEEGAP
ncbi:serine hydrolase [Chitinophagaceae bacterium 26-R-25]|nr:serine hydrolase [Chitinophagaceae bacterium 26-R-25]